MIKPISLSVTENNNGVKTYHVLFDDGTILSRLEGTNEWKTEQPVVSGHRDDTRSQQDSLRSNKRKLSN